MDSDSFVLDATAIPLFSIVAALIMGMVPRRSKDDPGPIELMLTVGGPPVVIATIMIRIITQLVLQQ